MSEDVKPRQFSIKFNGLYVPPLVTALASGKLKYEDEMVYVIELEPTLQLMKEMGDILEFCSRENVSSRESKFHAKEMVEKYRKFLEGVK